MSGTAMFTNCRFTSSANFDYLTVADDGGLNLSDARILGTFSLVDGTLSGRCQAEAARFKGRFQCDETTFDPTAEAHSFEGSTFSNTASFCRAAFGGTVTFEDCTFARTADFEGAHLHSAPEFPAASIAKATFVDVDPDPDLTLDFTGAVVRDGCLPQPTSTPLYYDLSEATLGSVDLGDGSGTDSDASLLEYYRFNQTQFDGFDFVAHEAALDAIDWDLHRFAGNREPLTAEECERTYLYAKTGAEAVGFSRAEGRFFEQEMEYRHEQLSTHGNLWEQVTHDLLGEVSGYGEQPNRVIRATWWLLVGFASVYFVVLSALRSSAEQISPRWVLVGSPESYYDGMVGAFLLSLESFTTLVHGGPTVESLLLRLVTAAEGLIGAFLIALFLFTLTKYIDR